MWTRPFLFLEDPFLQIIGQSKTRKERGEEKAFYITSRATEEPILEAVTEAQYRSWKKKKIIARKAAFIWVEDKGLWKIENQKDV